MPTMENLSALGSLVNNDVQFKSNLARLASAKRISSAADDPAGFSIAQTLQAEIGSSLAAGRSSNLGVSMAQVAEGAASTVQGQLSRMRELSVQASSGTINDSQRQIISEEISSIQAEINRVGESTEFNGQHLVSSDSTMGVQVGPNAGDQVDIEFSELSTAALGVDSVDVSTQGGAQAALDQIDAALQDVNSQRANYGVSENRLESAISNLYERVENTESARSRIEDADYAWETALKAQNQLKQDVSISIQAQANNMSTSASGLIW